MRTLRASGRPWQDTRSRWLISYADMVTLLFACSAALYAASVNTPPAPAPPPGDEVVESAFATPVDAALESALAAVVDQARLGHRVQMRTEGRSFVISLPEAGSFPIGLADLSQAARRVILDLSVVLTAHDARVRVEGHTDNTPVRGGRYASNWELSAARAVAVISFLVQQGDLDPARLSAAALGEFHPRQPNDSPAGRTANRRVDLIVTPFAPEDRQ